MRPWLPWVHQYGVGGGVFVASVWLAAKVGAFDRTRYSVRRPVVVENLV